jgi:hypothetical protein
MAYRGKPIRPWFLANLTVQQTTNVANGNHVEFDAGFGRGGTISLSTGTGQQLGIFSLPVGWIYRVHLALRPNLGNNVVTYQWQSHPGNSGNIGVSGATSPIMTVNDPGVSSTVTATPGYTLLVDCLLAAISIKLVKLSGSVPGGWQPTSAVFIEGIQR